MSHTPVINTSGGTFRISDTMDTITRTLAYISPGMTDLHRGAETTDSEWWLCQQIYKQQQDYAALEAQRDELLVALGDAVLPHTTDERMARARAAIARAEGKP